MNVIRDIDIKDLKEVFKRQIDLAVKKELTNVRINYVTALRILDVLEETQIREERHQTLESACTFMEMEDGTQTNEMELHNKTDANGNILRGVKERNGDWNTERKQMELHEKITKMVEHLQKEEDIIPKCFGTFSCDINMDKCFKCECTKECFIKTNSKKGVPDCYGVYDDKDLECINCEDKGKCAIETNKRKEEDNEKSCFGNYRDCYMCTHCIDCEKCKEETIHREDVEEDDDFI